MSSFRRNGSVSRAAEAASKNRLHMDRNPQHSRINDPSNPAGRRKEIDNVMKRARQASPGSWDRKLLEVEQKDPNRWRHTGYKQLYLDGSKSPSPRRSRSPVGPGRRSRSPIGLGRRSRSPMARRSPVRKSRSRSARRSPRREPRARRTPLRRGSPLRSPIRARRSPPRPRTPPPARRDTPPRRPAVRPLAARPLAPPQRPPEPPPRKSSPSGSSTGSCSDESCSVCSAKNKKINKPPGKPRSRSPSPARVKAPRPPPPKPGARPPRPVAPGASVVQPTRELLKAREASKRSREEKVLEWQRSQLAVNRPPPGAAPIPIPPQRIKREGERRPKEPRREERGVSPAAIQAALNESESDDESDASSEPQPQRLTLSERFGKMAAWSADRSARLENMRITRRQAGPGGLHVRIEPGPGGEPSDPADPLDDLDPAPIGSYPEELLAVAPSGLPSWDDVTVRYDYYKKRGYLRGLTLGDYVKWEEWWYKYQEWLKRERAYERWAEAEVGTVRRERRRRGGRHRRS